MTTKEKLENLISNLKRWQKIEDASIDLAEESMSRIQNPLVRSVFQILKHDSEMHRTLQQLVIDSLESESISLTPEDVGAIDDAITRHDEVEKNVVQLAQYTLDDLSGSGYQIQKFLLGYLLDDEKKHDKLLENLKSVKSSLYPYG